MSAVVVPVDVAALVVGTDDAARPVDGTGSFAALAAEFDAVASGSGPGGGSGKVNLGHALTAQPFASVAAGLPAGVHLHWALPAALAHGNTDGSGPVTFRSAPNRWLVVRIARRDTAPATPPDAAPDSALEAWVVESDRLWTRGAAPDPLATNRLSRAVPVTWEAGETTGFRLLGRAVRLADWTPDPAAPRLDPFTALGYGTPDFAAAYPHCPNVFGLHDPVDGLDGNRFPPASSTLTYLVVGWYARTADDPLSAFTPPAGADADGRAAAFHDAFGWDAALDPLPGRTVCAGVLRAVPWDPDRDHLDHPADAPAGPGIQVAIGNTAAEAVAALITAHNPNLPGLEEALAAFQLGHLDGLDTRAGLVAADDAMHQARFGSRSGGTVHTVSPSASSPSDPSPAAALPPDVAHRLNALNVAEQTLFAAAQDVDARRRQIFLDWYQYMLLTHDDRSEDADSVRHLVGDEIAALAAQVATTDAARSARDATRDALVAALPPGLALTSEEAPRYWLPADPVVLFSGEVVRPSVRHAGPDRPALLPCRRSADLPAPDPDGPALPNVAVLPPEAPALLAETVGLAAAAPAPARPGVVDWAQPWIPLAMQWAVHVFPVPDPTTLPALARLDDDAIDLTLTASPGALYQELRGSVPLTGRAAIDLHSQLDRHLANHPADAASVGGLRTRLDLPLMAQALAGFHESLLQRAPNIQLAVHDPIPPGRADRTFSNITVPPAVDQANTAAPLHDKDLHPVRACAVQLVRLRIVDAFGRWHDLDRPPVVVAGPLRTGALAPPVPGRFALLPPRLTQGGRLLFRWLAAADDLVETTAHPASTPVFGWVVYNHVDTRLMVYDAAGAAVGSLGTTAPIWQDAPGTAVTSGPAAAVSTAGLDRHLAAFLTGLTGRPDAGRYVAELLEAIDAQLTTINPHDTADHGVGLLFGQPLALVRASLRLETFGPFALDQSRTALTAAAHAGGAAGRPDGGIGQVRCPLRLGEQGLLHDGLVAWFVDDGTPATYRTCYCAAATATGTGVVPPDPDVLALTPTPPAQPDGGRVVAMIVDPRGVVHATTGLLPVKSVAIPPEHWTDALRRLAVSFRTAPVLAGGPVPALPLPAEPGMRWSWRTRTTTGWSPPADVAPPAPRIAAQRIEEGWLTLTPEERT